MKYTNAKGDFDLENKMISGQDVSIYSKDCGCGSDNCDCKPQCNFESWKAAMAYVPMQPWGKLYDFEQALKRGTLFPNLDLPFRGGGRK